MHSNQSNDELIQYLTQQNNYLQQYLQYMQTYINYSNVFEYYIDGVKVEQVKGTFQLGQLMEKELVELDGIHRFYIGEITIKEIEETGRVGVGVTEKSDKNKHQTDDPDEVSKDIKEVYDKINSLLTIENTPTFFQALSIQKEVLNKVWEIMNEQWNSVYEFNIFYENILKKLNESINIEVNIETPNFEDDFYIANANDIEEQAKTLLVISYLLEYSLPGYINKYINKVSKVNFKSLTISNQLGTIQQIEDSIKDALQLKNLPSSFEDVVDQPHTLRYLFYQILQPNVESGDVKHCIVEILLLINQSICINESLTSIDGLTAEEWAFLFANLLDYLNCYPKYILLNYILLQL